MYDNNTDTAYYDGKFGTLTIDFTNRTVEGSLDSEAIWRVVGNDSVTVRRMYEEIALETVDDGHDGDYFGYGMDRTDFGVVLENGDMKLLFDATGPVRFA